MILLIDRTLKISETTSDILSKKLNLQQFMQIHCRQRQYVFQVNFHFNDHYANFQTVYRSETTEQYRPTLITTMANSERVPSSNFTNTRVREFIQCFQCGKMRCLYSERALSAEEKIACQIAIDDWDYNC